MLQLKIIKNNAKENGLTGQSPNPTRHCYPRKAHNINLGKINNIEHEVHFNYEGEDYCLIMKNFLNEHSFCTPESTLQDEEKWIEADLNEIKA